MPKKANYAKFYSVYCAQPVPENHIGNVELTCPFLDCQKEEHFIGDCDSGVWHCVRCDRGGNARTLLTEIHNQYLELTTDAQYRFLSSLRGIDKSIFEAASFAYAVELDRWYVPYYTWEPETGEYSEFLNNLGYFHPSSREPKSQFAIHKASVLPVYLYNPGIRTEAHTNGIADIDEGEWDTLADYQVRSSSRNLILGKPGSGFSIAMTQTLRKCHRINLRLDNDPPGMKQLAKAVRVITDSKIGAKVYCVDWNLVQTDDKERSNQINPYCPKDVRDMLIERPTTMNDELERATVPYAVDAIAEEDRASPSYAKDASQFELITSFDEYFAHASKRFYVNTETRLAMIATFAITASISIPGEPLWGFLIGPPSSLKTQFIESFGGSNQWFDNLSKISAESLVSGWRDDTGDEPSYLPSLRDKTLFVKDFTVTIMDVIEKQKKVFGLLTDIYDGNVKIHFGNNRTCDYQDLYFNMVAGVTDLIHAHSSASIGERFLRIDWLGRDYDRREYTRRALANFGQSRQGKADFTKWTLGYYKHLRTQEIDMDIDPCYLEPIVDLAEFIAIVRTKVERDRYEGIMYKPRSELGPRLGLQLAKLYVGAKLVTRSAEDAFTVVRKVALDTCYGFSLDLVRFILAHPYSSREDIAHGTGIQATRAYRVLTDLCTTGVLSIHKHAGRGKREHYMLNPVLLPALLPEKYLDPERPLNGSNHQDRSANGRPRSFSPNNNIQSERRIPSKGRNRIPPAKD